MADSRVFDAPIAEGGIVAAAIGMGLYGLKPVAEIQFADYIFPGFDQIFSEAGRIRYRTAGEWSVPMVIRSPYGGGIFGGQTHSQSPEAFFAHMPGIKTVIPSNPYDAKGLLIAAIEDPDPVVFFEPKRIYNGPFDGFYERPVTPWAKHPAAEVPEGHYTVPLGKAAVAREGEAVTILAYGTMVHVAIATAEAEGIDAEVIDLRTIVPVDIETIEESVKKTGRCVVLHEATRTAGFGAELAALVQERCFYHLEAPVRPRHRLRHALSPFDGMDLFPGPGAAWPGAQSCIGGLTAMARYEFKLPDIGEGIAEAEIVAWHVKVGDSVAEDQQLADMMTDKATVEMESPVAGKVLEVAGEVGDMIAIGSVLVVIETEGAAAGRRPAEEPIADGMAEVPEALEEVVPTTDVEAEERRDASARNVAEAATGAKANGAIPSAASGEWRAADRPRRTSASTRADRSASPGGPRPRPRSRHRPVAGQICGRPRPPRRSRRLSALQWRQRRARRRRAAAAGRGGQGRRPPPQDRREHAGGEAPHPAFHPGRGI